jgi:uncharacterized protein (TIGR02246 family)
LFPSPGFFIDDKERNMDEQALEELVHAADRAINARDLDALMAFYDPDACLVVNPGKIVSGKEAIRKAFEAIFAYFNHSLVVEQGQMRIVQTGDTALVLSETRLTASGKADSAFSMRREATYVYRRDAQERWRCCIDNSYGAELLRHPPA